MKWPIQKKKNCTSTFNIEAFVLLFFCFFSILFCEMANVQGIEPLWIQCNIVYKGRIRLFYENILK